MDFPFILLSRLVHLTELKLSNVHLDLVALKRAHLTPFLTVRKLKLVFVEVSGTKASSATFCRLIANIFPNLEELRLHIRGRVRMIKLGYEAILTISTPFPRFIRSPFRVEHLLRWPPHFHV